MCNGGFETRPKEAVVPAIALARLMERELGHRSGDIDAVALRLFMIAHWRKVSALAHQIHEEGIKSGE